MSQIHSRQNLCNRRSINIYICYEIMIISYGIYQERSKNYYEEKKFSYEYYLTSGYWLNIIYFNNEISKSQSNHYVRLIIPN